MQQVMLKDNIPSFRQITKTFESDIIPHTGDYICDSVWKDPYEQEVLQVTINYQESECYVQLPVIALDTDRVEAIKEYIEMAKLHEWECAVPPR